MLCVMLFVLMFNCYVCVCVLAVGGGVVGVVLCVVVVCV